ncbi:MAG TPA: MFS transporter [Stellaceae bacterium]|nr:MFS transporter [Stellaceae bacterium]
MTVRAAAAIGSVETRRSWLVALTALAIVTVSFGAPMITVVALRPIAAAFGNLRAVPALSLALAWLGSALGGIALAQLAERIGIRWTVILGALMIAVGLVLASLGERWSFYIGHGVFMGLLGNAGINAPLYVYVSRWFDRRRGTALALIASGQAAAGTIWAPLFGHAIGWFGWARTMQLYAGCEILVIVPAAFLVLRALPGALRVADNGTGPAPGALVLGLKSRTALGLIAAAGFCCCVPMAMPQGHLVAFCGDVGIPLTRGSAMLSVLLACAFVGRQCWGVVADRIGGLRTVLAGSFCQIVAMTGFMLTRNEAGLFAVSVAFGLGFSGIVPAYVVAVRELFPASEASWRIPTVLLFSGSGMAMGGWLAGAIYDYAGFYAPAFAAGILFNLVNFIVVGTLVFRQSRFRSPLLARA